MVEPLLSVIVPVRNGERYLEEALQSLLDQRVPLSEMEIILVDHASEDGTAGMLADFARRIPVARVLRLNDPAGGPGAARNAGVDAATGRYLSFLDADDLLTPDGLDALLHAVRRDEAEIGFGDFSVFDGTGMTEMRSFSALFGRWFGPFDVVSCPPVVAKPPALASCLFARELVRREEIRFPEGIVAQDAVFWVRGAVGARSIIYHPGEVYRYRSPWHRPAGAAPSYSAASDVGYFLGLLAAMELSITALADTPDPTSLAALPDGARQILCTTQVRYLATRLSRPEVTLAPDEVAHVEDAFRRYLHRVGSSIGEERTAAVYVELARLGGTTS
jgi:glycosyltransferase involved in cell wall biosynthesis